ncbi:GNAT family N-acetyltransferase [Streptomyces sp. NPDC020681]|uniref:GNAT family N-acetyltransferase n=1 Tax=Streptomyces sp. NPDC020681 TaxID=3365083 RepID=UPI0037A8E65E
MTKSTLDLRPNQPATAPTVRVLDGQAARDFLTSNWPALYEQTPWATPYQSPQWLRAHADHLPHTAKLQILVAHSHAASRAALAVVRDRSIAGRMETTPLSAPEAEYVRLVGPEAEQPAVAAAIARTLSTLGTDVMLPDVPANSALGRYIAQWPHVVTPCARIQLPVDYTAMSRSTQRDHRRRRRTWQDLSANGHTVVYRRTSTVQELLDAYPVLAHLHRLRWSGPQTDQQRLNPADARFRTILERCASMAFIASLSVDEDVIAAQLCLHLGRNVYSLLPAMDPARLDLAPGHALLRHLTQQLADAGFSTLDLGRTTAAPGQAAYKAQYLSSWTSTLTTALRNTEPHQPDSDRRAI